MRFVSCCVILQLLILVAGCEDNKRSVAPVSGRIMLDGKPLAGGSIVTQPLPPPGSLIAGKGSGAYCDADGRFQLETLDGRAGAIVGEHRVRIYGPRDPKAMASERDGGGTTTREIVPAKYNKNTELTLTVPVEGTSEANFNLTKK